VPVYASSDGVEVAVHDLGGSGPRLLISHATGFHGHAYDTLAAALGERFHCISFDYRGHGDTRTPPRALDGSVTGKKYDWERYADDALTVARHVRDDEGGPLIAFGHSMGGAGLLMAAHRDRSLFRALVLFEPIVFPPDPERQAGAANPLADGARRRRASFPSYDAAIANYSEKRPLSTFPADALDSYVRHGFGEGEDGQVHLKCLPETEAGTFEGSGHATWELLPDILVPTLVLAGEAEPGAGPAALAPLVADQLPNGRYTGFAELDHFGPMTHPELIAQRVREMSEMSEISEIGD
jgi:pimeloyl-ACP methyl ester carboxylesterase